MAEKSRVLVIGGAGYIGKFIVKACAKSGHPTFVLETESTLSNPANAEIIKGFKSLGVNLVHGDIYDQKSLLSAIKQVDVVISTVGQGQLEDQDRIVAAIKAAGNIKSLEMMWIVMMLWSQQKLDMLSRPRSAALLRLRESLIHLWLLTLLEVTTFGHCHSPGLQLPLEIKLSSSGMEMQKEDDIGTYTIKAVDDPRTLNKILYIKPPANTYSMNELVSLWERKIGKTLQRVCVPEEQVLKNIQEAAVPRNVILALYHSIFVKGDQTNFEIEPLFGVEASALYPDVKYMIVDQCLDQFV